MTVGQRIRERRIELGLTQTDLAIKMGYSGKSSVCAAEVCGDNITTTKVTKFAKALDCSPMYLMFGNEEQDKPDEKTSRLIEEVRKRAPSDEDIIEEYLSLAANDINEVKEFMEFYKVFKTLPPQKRQAILALLELPQSDS